MVDYKKILLGTYIALSLIGGGSIYAQDRNVKMKHIRPKTNFLEEKLRAPRALSIRELDVLDEAGSESNFKEGDMRELRGYRVPVYEMGGQRVEEAYGARELQSFPELEGQERIGGDRMSGRDGRSSFYPVVVDRVNDVVERGYRIPIDRHSGNGDYTIRGGNYREFQEPIHIFMK